VFADGFDIRLSRKVQQQAGADMLIPLHILIPYQLAVIDALFYFVMIGIQNT